MNIDEEETVGLLYQGGQRKRAVDDPLRRNRAANPGAWKYAAAWVFFTFFSIFLSLLVVKVITNNIVSNSSTFSETTKASTATKTTTTNMKPNFIFVLADDLGYGAVNEPHFPYAPNLSKMAQDGIIMSNYYTQELCAPSRAALLTGRYPAHLGMQFGQLTPTLSGGLTLDATLLPQILKSDGNYKSYAFGKWNLGHSSPDYLPTARGFDYHLGYLTTENTYWSKSMAEFPGITDFMESDKTGYWFYEGADINTYSTDLYGNHARKAIRSHDFSQQSMFMYLAFQAAHPPFEDLTDHLTGLVESDLPSDIWNAVQKYTAGHHRQQYILSLYLLDRAVQEIWNAVEDVGQADNTYLIFASDNGGCPQDGGSNGQFRGTKGTLFEGGVRVDAFLYHPSLKSQGLSREYKGLMHVSDWLPSMLTLAGISTSALTNIDGHSHASTWLTKQQISSKKALEGPRDHVLYNYYYNVDNVNLDINRNASVAIRDSQFKLIHTFINNDFDGWHDVRSDKLEENDDVLVLGPRCTEDLAMKSGTFTFMLFDLINDPKESTNLYNDPAFEAVRIKLRNILLSYEQTIVAQPYLLSDTVNAVSHWSSSGHRAQPWILSDSDVLKKKT